MEGLAHGRHARFGFRGCQERGVFRHALDSPGNGEADMSAVAIGGANQGDKMTDRVKAGSSVAAFPVGSYATDFQAAFGVGDGVTISPIDAIGVCLAAIQALSQKVESPEAQLTGVEFLRAA
jgi:hypothetical protein